MSGGHSRRGGNWCVNCGVTQGRITAAYRDGEPLPCVRPDTPCGHPLAARAVESYFGGKPTRMTELLRTVCWACKVEAA